MINPSIYSETEEIPLKCMEERNKKLNDISSIKNSSSKYFSIYIYISVPFTKFKGMQNKK